MPESSKFNSWLTSHLGPVVGRKWGIRDRLSPSLFPRYQHPQYSRIHDCIHTVHGYLQYAATFLHRPQGSSIKTSGVAYRREVRDVRGWRASEEQANLACKLGVHSSSRFARMYSRRKINNPGPRISSHTERAAIHFVSCSSGRFRHCRYIFRHIPTPSQHSIRSFPGCDLDALTSAPGERRITSPGLASVLFSLSTIHFGTCILATVLYSLKQAATITPRPHHLLNT